MKNADINFKSIIPRGGSQTKAFEEICAQIARKMSGNNGKFERYHGDGGDGGVECVVKFSDGSIAGWQSKFVDNVDGLIKQCSLSLATAIKVHPKLKKYIVCFPFDLTGRTGRKDKNGQPAQSGISKVNNWVTASLKTAQTEGHFLKEIEIWSASRIMELLLEYDVSAGIRNYFFSDKILTSKWFEENITVGIAKAGPRYSPALNVQTNIWQSLSSFGLTEEWSLIVIEEIDKTQKKLKEFSSNINKSSNDPVFPGFDPKYAAHATDICGQLTKLAKAIQQDLSKDHLEILKKEIVQILQLIDNLEKSLVEDLNIQNRGEQWDNKRWRSFMAEYMVSFPAACLDKTRELYLSVQGLSDFIHSPSFSLAAEKLFVLSGIGGSGKTHSICDIALERMKNGLLSCVVFGDQFSGNPDEWTRFGEAIGAKDINSDELLDALNAAAEQTGKPLIIFIDAINETIRRDYWSTRITSFAQKVVERPFLKLCISCRSSFLKTSLPNPSSFLTVEHVGFKGLEREACNTFFNFYGLLPPIIPILQPELGNPLYLKLVCETLRAKDLKSLPMGWNGLLPVIKAFLHEKEIQLARQSDLSAHGAVVVTSLTAVIKEIADKAESSLSWRDAVAVIAKTYPPINSHNLLDWLVKADLLIEDGSISEEELVDITYVRPSFERLGDFLLATEISNLAMATGVDCFLQHLKIQELFKDETSVEYYSNLVAALSVILPENYNIELPSLLIDTDIYNKVCSIATKSLKWRTPNSLTHATQYFVEDVMREDGYTGMDALLAICANKSELDALFLSGILKHTDLPYRDAFFSSYLYTSYNENSIVKRLINAHGELELSNLDDDTALRWMIALVWITSSPDRRIKDTATRAVIDILKHKNHLGSELLNTFMFVNDEEVVERMLLIIYAAQILSPDIVALKDVSNIALGNYSANLSEFQNALIRDHIRCIGELAQKFGCIPQSTDATVSNQVNKSGHWLFSVPAEDVINEWKKERGARDLAASSALDDDFNHYTINCLDPWEDQLSKSDLGKWIIHDVVERKGLNDEIHNPYDITIVQETGGRRSKPAYAERLGKKYQWNALYRLASILHDNLERSSRRSEPDFMKLPFILQEERKLDPTFTQPYLKYSREFKNWWIKEKADLSESEKLTYKEWLNFRTDIPRLQNIICPIRHDGQNWIPISGLCRFNDKKKDSSYNSPYRLLSIDISSFLVKEADFTTIVAKLNGKNLFDDRLPEGGTFSHCYAGEYPWGTACNHTPEWYLGIGDTFSDSAITMHNTTNDICMEWEYDSTFKGSLYLQVPSKRLFELGDLWWNGKDGYETSNKKTVFKDPRIETGGELGMVADYDDLVSRLKKLGYGMIWVFKGKKMLVNDLNPTDRKYFSQIAWMDFSGQIFFGKRMFFKNHDSKRGSEEK